MEEKLTETMTEPVTEDTPAQEAPAAQPPAADPAPECPACPPPYAEGTGSTPVTLTRAEFARMGYRERLTLKHSDPAAYAALRG